MTAKILDDRTIGDASKAQIIAFAKEHAGLEFSGDEDRSYMESEVFKAMDWQERDPADDATHVVVRLGKEFGKEGVEGYRGGFKGRMFTIPREKDTEIPIEFYDTIIQANSRGFRLQPMDKFKEGSPHTDRIETSGVPISVVKFLKKEKV